MINKETIEEVKNRLIKTYDPIAIYVFGSYACGSPSEDWLPARDALGTFEPGTFQFIGIEAILRNEFCKIAD